MRLAFVLSSISGMSTLRFKNLNVDCIYYFEANSHSPPSFPAPSFCLPSPQLDSEIEAAIIEASIERNIKCLTNNSDDDSLMRRALRLSELRIEARCYLNAVKFLRQEKLSPSLSIGSITFISHYLLPPDIADYTEFHIQWHQVPNIRFMGLIPGARRLLFLLGYSH